MKPNLFARPVVVFAAVLIPLLLLGQASAFAQEMQPETAAESSAAESAKTPPEQLDSLVAPIALYPDPLLAQTLAASTYPIEVMQLGQWVEKNKDLKDQALIDAVQKQKWDPSVQAMAAFPEVAKRMAGNIQWTSDMGNAFLAQQGDVMDAIQRMRAKAESKGALKTSEQQKVEKKTVGGEQVIVVEQANPSTVYVPSYDPAVVYGETEYPYPSYSYPGYVAGGALAFGTGLALGAAWSDDDWGWGCGWGDDEIEINVNNNYVSNYNKQNNIQAGGGKWEHKAEHRGNAPYGDRGTAQKFGGRAAGEPAGAGRQGSAGGVGGAGGVGKPGGAGGVGKAGGIEKGGIGSTGGAGKPGGPGAGKPGGAGDARPATKQASRPSGGGGADQIGSKNLGSKDGPSARGGGAISGGGGHQARASSDRGGKSMGGGGLSSGGGGRKGGGGGRR